MGWLQLATITPGINYQFAGPVETGVVRVRHRIQGVLATQDTAVRLRLSALIGFGSNFQGLVTVSEVRRLFTNQNYELFRFTYDEDQLTTDVVIWAPFNSLDNIWQVLIEEWDGL